MKRTDTSYANEPYAVLACFPIKMAMKRMMRDDLFRMYFMTKGAEGYVLSAQTPDTIVEILEAVVDDCTTPEAGILLWLNRPFSQEKVPISVSDIDSIIITRVDSMVPVV